MTKTRQESHWIEFGGHPVPEAILYWAKRSPADYPDELRQHLACCIHCSDQLQFAQTARFAMHPIIDDYIEPGTLSQCLDELAAQYAAPASSKPYMQVAGEEDLPQADGISKLARLWCALVQSLGSAITSMTGRAVSFASTAQKHEDVRIEHQVRSFFELEVSPEDGEIYFPDFTAAPDREIEELYEAVNDLGRYFTAGLAWKADGTVQEISLEHRPRYANRVIADEGFVYLLVCLGADEEAVKAAASVLNRYSTTPIGSEGISLPPGVVVLFYEVMRQ